jgi:hypothetical protein
MVSIISKVLGPISSIHMKYSECKPRGEVRTVSKTPRKRAKQLLPQPIEQVLILGLSAVFPTELQTLCLLSF